MVARVFGWQWGFDLVKLLITKGLVPYLLPVPDVCRFGGKKTPSKRGLSPAYKGARSELGRMTPPKPMSDFSSKAT